MSSSQKFTSVLETIEPTKLKLTVTVSPEAFRAGLHEAYTKNKGYFTVQGFRKGRAPRKMIEQLYGREVFYEDALNAILPEAYEAALDEHELEPVYRPEIEPGPAGENEGAIFYATFHIRPEAEIDGYYGLTYPKNDAEPTDDEIEQAIAAEQAKSATQVTVDRAAEMGDVVIINFKGFIDGEPFEGGEGNDHELTLGAKQFIDTFEEQLVGHIAGDDITVNVTFPEEYHHAEYAGKAATFEVEILDVQGKILPEIDDEFASNVSDFDTLAEYRADLTASIKKNKEANLENMKRGHIMKQLVEKVIVDVPEDMYLARLDDMMDEFARHIQMQGMNLETYMRFTGMTPEQLKIGWRAQAETEVKNMLTLEAIAKKESITITDEEFAERLGKMIVKEGDELTGIIESLHPARRKEFNRSVLCEKAMELVLEKAIEVDEPMPVFSADAENTKEEPKEEPKPKAKRAPRKTKEKPAAKDIAEETQLTLEDMTDKA